VTFLDWGALVVGGGLMTSGVRAIRRREAHVPERYEGAGAVRLGWLWLGLGGLFVAGVVFDLGPVKALFLLFLEAAN
jgi:hypothetical protein